MSDRIRCPKCLQFNAFDDLVHQTEYEDWSECSETVFCLFCKQEMEVKCEFLGYRPESEQFEVMAFLKLHNITIPSDLKENYVKLCLQLWSSGHQELAHTRQGFEPEREYATKIWKEVSAKTLKIAKDEFHERS